MKGVGPDWKADCKSDDEDTGSTSGGIGSAATTPGSCTVSTRAVANTDLYYLAVFASQAAASPADGTTPRILTLTTSSTPKFTLGGLLSGKKYWLRWRSHNASAATIARGWRDFEPTSTCTATPTKQGRLQHLARPRETTAVARNGSSFMYLFRVSEYTDEVDFLENHNSASAGAQAGFLTNTNSGLFFNFTRTAVSRYCVEYLPKTVADPHSDPANSPAFAAYVSCNGPEGREWGNTPADPICICDVWSDRMIAHEPAAVLRAAKAGCLDGKGGPPAPNQTSQASHFFIGRDPQFLPYLGPCCPVSDPHCESCWDPEHQLEIGGDFSTPKAGQCRAGQSMGNPLEGGCTWRASPEVDVIYGGRDLTPRGWEFAPGSANATHPHGHYPEAGMNTTGTTLHNVGVFERAWAAHDAELGPRSCGPSHP